MSYCYWIEDKVTGEGGFGSIDAAIEAAREHCVSISESEGEVCTVTIQVGEHIRVQPETLDWVLDFMNDNLQIDGCEWTASKKAKSLYNAFYNALLEENDFWKMGKVLHTEEYETTTGAEDGT